MHHTTSYPISNYVSANQQSTFYTMQAGQPYFPPPIAETNHGGPNGKGFDIIGPKGDDRHVSEADCKTLGIPVGSLFGDAPVEDYYPYGDPGAYGTPVQPATIEFMNSEAYTGQVKLPLHVLKGLMWGEGAVPVPWGQAPK
jgi:hypothetical protein